MYRQALIAGTVTGALAVLIGAFGAHGLKEFIDAGQMAIFEKGVTYQFYHSFALLATGMLYRSYQYKAIRFAYYFFLFGIMLFSGSLYLLVAIKILGGDSEPFGFLTPLGGLLFVAGWISLLVGILRKK